MSRRLLIALAVLPALGTMNLAASASPQPEQPAVKRPAAAQPAVCDYLGLRLGPAVELSAGDEVTIDGGREMLRIASDGDTALYDLDHGGSAEVKEPVRFPKKPRAEVASLAPGTTLSGRGDAAEDLASRPERVLPNGRPVEVSRLYVNNYIIKIGSEDRDAYRRFGEGLLAGTYCGAPIADLSPELKQKLKPMVTYFLFDALSSGRLDDYASWVKYSPVFKTFLDIKETEEFLEVYGYRAAEQGVREPGLKRMDPDKLWTFAWNAAAKLFHDKDFTEFTDLSAYQRDGRMTFIALGSQPIPGGETNKYGFYTKLEGSMPVASVDGPRSFHWSWTQGDRTYAADIGLTEAVQHPKPQLQKFPGLDHHGLLMLDATLSSDDVEDLLTAYQDYFRARGFTFGPRMPVPDVPQFVENEMGTGHLDYLLRDGHSDGDDENLVVLYPSGLMIEGRRPGKDGDDTVRIVFNLEKSPPQRRIPYEDFYRLLDQRAAGMKTPLVFIDGSCWGIEKAWFPLAVEPSSRLIEIASNSSVNFFDAVDRNAMRRLVDGILQGRSFASIRSSLEDLRGYKSRREDWFVLPDDPLYPQAGPILAVRKRLTVELPGQPPQPYTPDGYI